MTETKTPQPMSDLDLDFAYNAAYWSGRARQADAQRAAEQRLRDLKGQTVQVVAGRKVPLGTSGVCFWSGEGRYGWRVGFTTADGETVWTDARNVEADVAS